MDNSYVLLLIIKKEIQVRDFMNYVVMHEEKGIYSDYVMSWSKYSTTMLSEFEFNYLRLYLMHCMGL